MISARRIAAVASHITIVIALAVLLWPSPALSQDNCPEDPDKTEPGQCGCGVADTDGDSDGTADCNDNCPADANKTDPGICDCGTPDVDDDNDDTADCVDDCVDVDSDGYGRGNECPDDCDDGSPACNVDCEDYDGNGTADCRDEACSSDKDCDEYYCDEESGRCVQCLEDAHCSQGSCDLKEHTCVAWDCVSDKDCVAGDRCDKDVHRCVPVAGCANHYECPQSD